MREWMYRRFLDLGTSWRWVVSFKARPLYPRRKSLRYPLDRRLGGPQSRSGRRGEENILDHPTGTRTPTPRSSSPQPLCLRRMLMLSCLTRFQTAAVQELPSKFLSQSIINLSSNHWTLKRLPTNAVLRQSTKNYRCLFREMDWNS
jgi:hypothetical protein